MINRAAGRAGRFERSHAFARDERIDNSLFDGFDGSLIERIKGVVGNERHRLWRTTNPRYGYVIRNAESQKDIAEIVAAGCTIPADAYGRSLATRRS
jgi:hypothetical protein